MPQSHNLSTSVGKPTPPEEEEIDIDLDDPEVQAAANMIQAKFKGKLKGKFGMKKSTTSKPEASKSVTTPDKSTGRATSPPVVSSPRQTAQVDVLSVRQIIHVDEVEEALGESLDDHVTSLGEAGLGVPTIGFIPSTPRMGSPASSMLSSTSARHIDADSDVHQEGEHAGVCVQLNTPQNCVKPCQHNTLSIDSRTTDALLYCACQLCGYLKTEYIKFYKKIIKRGDCTVHTQHLPYIYPGNNAYSANYWCLTCI